jgi:small subunit ribosomal protein S6
MNKYEIIYVIDAAVEEAARKELVEKFNGIITANNGEVVKVEDWGKRRLAYAIDYKTEGYYVYVAFNGEADLPKELSRNLGNNENILRSQIVKLLDKKHSVKPRPVHQAPEAAPAVEEAPVEEAVAEEAPVEAPVEEAQAPVEEA